MLKFKNILISLSNSVERLYRDIRWKLQRLRTTYEWAKFGYSSYDWDFSSLFQVWQFKLNRIYKVFKKCRWHDHSKVLRQMNEMRRLFKILCSDFAEEYSEKLISKKWGPYIKKECEWSVLGFGRKKINDKADYKQYWKDYKKAYRKGTQLHSKALDQFLKLVKLHHQNWSC